MTNDDDGSPQHPAAMPGETVGIGSALPGEAVGIGAAALPGEAARISVLGAPSRPDHPAAHAILAICAGLGLMILVLVLIFFSSLANTIGGLMVEDGRAPIAADGAPIAAAPALPRPIVPPPDRMLRNAALRGNPGEFFGADVYPAEAIRNDEQGRTVAKLAIDPSGTPVGCTIAISSGSRSLDAATCAIAIGKVRFTPARDGRGVAIASSYTLPVRWVLPR